MLGSFARPRSIVLGINVVLCPLFLALCRVSRYPTYRYSRVVKCCCSVASMPVPMCGCWYSDVMLRNTPCSSFFGARRFLAATPKHRTNVCGTLAKPLPPLPEARVFLVGCYGRTQPPALSWFRVGSNFDPAPLRGVLICSREMYHMCLIIYGVVDANRRGVTLRNDAWSVVKF